MDTVDRPTEERRRDSRWNAGGTEARIAPKHNASLLNISRGGALIEHSHPVRPGTVLLLTLVVPYREISLRCQVIRSLEHRYEARSTEERDHFYRTRLQFLAVSEEYKELVDKYIDFLKDQK
jgi:hypothetical protein